MEVIIKDNAEAGCVLGAKIIAKLVREKPECVLGLATGRTPLQLYQELIRLHRMRRGSISARLRPSISTSMSGCRRMMSNPTDGS